MTQTVEKQAMPERILGDGLKVSAIGLGCLGMSFGYGAADETESIKAILAAHENAESAFVELTGEEMNELDQLSSLAVGARYHPERMQLVGK